MHENIKQDYILITKKEISKCNRGLSNFNESYDYLRGVKKGINLTIENIDLNKDLIVILNNFISSQLGTRQQREEAKNFFLEL